MDAGFLREGLAGSTGKKCCTSPGCNRHSTQGRQSSSNSSPSIAGKLLPYCSPAQKNTHLFLSSSPFSAVYLKALAMAYVRLGRCCWVWMGGTAGIRYRTFFLLIIAPRPEQREITSHETVFTGWTMSFSTLACHKPSDLDAWVPLNYLFELLLFILSLSSNVNDGQPRSFHKT